jgi:hypothetical protein
VARGQRRQETAGQGLPVRGREPDGDIDGQRSAGSRLERIPEGRRFGGGQLDHEAAAAL